MGEREKKSLLKVVILKLAVHVIGTINVGTVGEIDGRG